MVYICFAAVIMVTIIIIAIVMNATLDERCGNSKYTSWAHETNAVEKNPHPATYRWQNGWIETICKNTLTISNIIRVVEKWDVQCSFKMQALIWSRIWQKFNIIMLSQCRGWTENEWFPYIADVNICRVTVRLLLLLQSCSVFHISILATEFKNSLLTIQSHAVADDGCSSAYKNNRYNKDFLL